MAIPTITPLSEAPSRQETEETFVPKADALLAQLPVMVEEENLAFQWIEDQGNLIDTARDETYTARDVAIDAKVAAIAASNWIGDWETATGAGVAGTSYTYANLYVYLLKVNLANIQSSEPSFTNTNWQLINEIPFEPSVKPTMVLDFANENFEIYDGLGSGFAEKPLNNIVTHTRASSATGVDPIGRVGTVGPNIPRLVFEDGVAKGYLSEESRTNLLTQSEFENGLSDAPNQVGLVTLDSMDYGTGSVNALAFGYDGNTTSYARKTNFTPSIGTTYTLSVFVEMDDGLPPVFNSSTNSSPLNDFVVQAGSNNGNITEYEVDKIYGNIYKVSSKITSTSTNNLTGVVKYSTSSPRTFKVTGYQLEEGSFPTSYIKTQASTVTRSGGSMVRTLGNEWNPNEGTFVVEFEGFANSDVNTQYVFALTGASGYLYLFRAITGSFTLQMSIAGSVYPIVGIDLTSMAAISISDEKMEISTDRGDYRTISVSSGVFDFDTATIGNILSGIRSLNGTIKHFQYYPRAFDALTLQHLSRIQ